MATRTRLAVVFGLVMGFLAMGARGEEMNLAGSWEHVDPSGLSVTLVFNSDGTGKMANDSVKWSLAGNTLSLEVGGDVIKYTVKVEKDILAVTGGDLDKPLVFKRKDVPVVKKGLGGKLESATKQNTPGVEAGATEAKPAAAPKGSLIGKWQDDVGAIVEITEKAVLFQGATMPYTKTEDHLTVSIQGLTMQWNYKLDGDKLTMKIGDQTINLTRQGAEKENAAGNGAAAGAKAGKLVGNWEGPDGLVLVREDGTIRSKGEDGKWGIDEKYITLTDKEGNWLKIPYKFEGDDKLVLGTGPTQTLTRAKGYAGVWVGSESTVGANSFLNITQYVTLYSDGTVGFQKTEGAVTRRQVTDELAKFTHVREKQGEKGKTYGKWSADGNTITIQWEGAFGNRTMTGRADSRTMKMEVRGIGILEEGATVTFERQ